MPKDTVDAKPKAAKSGSVHPDVANPISATPVPGKSDPGKQKPTDPGPVSRENAEHYRWGTNCDAWFMVKDKHLTVIEEFMPPGAAEIRHYHEKAQQFFYILTGEVMMEVEGQTMLIHAGSGIHVLPGRRHQIRNPSSSAARFLVISQPPSRGDRVAK
jgi:mannose-6-phosphate isomerase-like protein (cupin superfamily)